MKFPVDLLADVSLAELEQSAHNYMNNLLHSNPDSPEHLTISASTKVTIDISSVGFIPLYGSNDTWKILALFSPSDPFIAVGLYLLDRWWAVEDILKTADPVRDGAVEVDTVGERIVLYILNRVIYRGKEMTSEDLPFLCHGEKDYAKIVWNNGEAVGFYSVKPSGSICNSFSVRTYQLPVMDSIFVRKCQRRKGFGLQMLVDFVLSFKEESLGLRYPLTKSMYKVCEKYLCQYPGDTDLLWEVESVGGPNQRTNIAKKIMAIDISVSKSLSFSEESLLTPDVAEGVLKETITVECSAETMEEVTVLRATKEIDDVPVVGQSRSSGLKRRKIGEKITEDKSEKVIRIEDIEAETPSKDQVSVQRKTTLHDSYEPEQTEVLLSVTKEKAEDVVDTAPEGEPTIKLYKPATALMSKDLAEADVTSAIMTEEQHIQGGATQDQNEPHDSQITVENVASETQEAEVNEKEGEADIPFGGDAEENILPMEFDKEISWKNEETPANDDKVQGIYVEETKVIETRVLRSGEQTVTATTRIKTTKRQDGEEEEEADGLKSNGDKPAEERAVREGRKSAATARQQSKQAQEETIITEEIQVDETKAVLEESEERKESREKAEAVAGVSPAEQETVEKEPSTVSVTCVDREDMASIWECAEGTPDERKVPSEEEAVTVETTILRSGGGTVRATLQSETTVRQDNDEQEQDTTKEKSTKEDESVFRKRMLRKDMTAGVHQTEEEEGEEEEEESTPAKEIHIAETKDNINDEIEEKDGEEDACQKDDTEDTLNTNVEKVSNEIKAPAVETRLLRSGGKLVKTIPVTKATKSHHEQNTLVGMLGEKSADTDKLAVETRMLRKGRRSAPATPREKSKRRRTQCQPEKQSQKTATAQEMEGEEDEVGQESPEKEREKAEEERKRMGMEVEHSNDAEQGEAESAPGAESVVGDTEQMQDSLIEETAVIEGDRGDSSKTDLVETDIIQISSAEVEETNSTEEEGITEIKKSTAVTVVLPDTSTAEEEALVKGASVMAEEAAPTATRISLSTKTKTSHAKLTQSSRSQKDQEQVKTNIQQLEEESLGDVATQEVHPLTDNPPEKRKLKDEQSEAEETSSTGHGADEDILQYINRETADSRAVDSVGEETQSGPDKEEEEKVESNEDKDNMTYDFSDSQQIKKLEESSKEENLENAVKAGEKGNILNPTLETDEEEETLGSSQKQEKDEQNMSEDEVEPIVIEKRILRWRTVPSVIITPRSKSRRHSTKVPKAEESSSDEEKSPQSSKRRSFRKRKSTEVTLTPKFKRPSRVQEVLHTTIKCKK